MIINSFRRPAILRFAFHHMFLQVSVFSKSFVTKWTKIVLYLEVHCFVMSVPLSSFVFQPVANLARRCPEGHRFIFYRIAVWKRHFISKESVKKDFQSKTEIMSGWNKFRNHEIELTIALVFNCFHVRNVMFIQFMSHWI